MIRWIVAGQFWQVPSATVAGEWHNVKRVRRDAHHRWWLTLQCSCPADTVNRRAVCWHKAAVVLRWERIRAGWRPPD